MYTNKKILPKNEVVKRNATEPYTMQLDNEDYMLTGEVLKRNVESRTQKSRDWPLPKLRFISFKDGKLELRNTCNKISFLLTILIEKDKLNVSCSCGSQVEMLCLHEYEAFQRMAWYDRTIDFDDYKPGGLLEIGIKNKKYFTTKPSQRGLDISPKPILGAVYQLNNRIPKVEIHDLLKLSSNTLSKHPPSTEIALSYLIMNPHRNEFLPFLMPCIGKLNKAGTSVKCFYNFGSAKEKKYSSILNEKQRELNDICSNMWKIIQNLPGTIMRGENVKGITQKNKEALRLWHKALPLLSRQQFLYSYHFYGEKELKSSPTKRQAEEVRIVNDFPSLRFQLIDKEVFYQFKMYVNIKDVQMGNYDSELPFFIRHRSIFYMLANMRDAAVVEWMQRSSGLITVFKQHYQQFHTDILKPIQECYKVEMVRFLNKREKNE